MSSRSFSSPLLLSVVLVAAQGPAAAQWPPDSLTNLQVLPEDIGFRELVGTMAGFTRALGVRCSYCHVGEEGQPLGTYNFAADDKLTKRKARRMLRMVRAINEEHLSGLDTRADPPVRVECATCHRGTQRPRMLQDVLIMAYDAGGYDSTVAVYRRLREQYYGRYTYDFSNIVLPDVAGQLAQRGAVDDAVRLLKMNVELYPESEFARRQYAQMALQQTFDDDIHATVARYRELNDELQGVAEFVLNSVGYTLLGRGRVEDAITVFRLNVDAYPESWNAYDSLGEAYMEHGEVDLAIRNYERSLELNPNNTNAVSKLRELRAGR